MVRASLILSSCCFLQLSRAARAAQVPYKREPVRLKKKKKREPVACHWLLHAIAKLNARVARPGWSGPQGGRSMLASKAAAGRELETEAMILFFLILTGDPIHACSIGLARQFRTLSSGAVEPMLCLLIRPTLAWLSLVPNLLQQSAA